MAIVAYTSAQPNPQVTQLDKVIDLSTTPLPVALAQLYGDAVDSTDPAPVFTFAWTILAKPPTSAAAFVDPALQDPELGPIDVWGNYRLFLVATNTNSGETSETNPLKAPNTAFVHVRCLGAQLGLEKPAPGERNWHERYWELVEELEGGGAGGVSNFVDLLDILALATPPTPANLQTLVDGSYALKAGPVALHIHRGPDVDQATAAARGTVVLEDPPLNGANPKVVNQERITLQASADGTMSSVGYKPGVIEPPGAAASYCHAAWYVPEELSILEWIVVLSDAGGVPGDYSFRPVRTPGIGMGAAPSASDDYEANNWQSFPDDNALVRDLELALDDAQPHASVVPGGPMVLRLSATAPGMAPWTAAAGHMIGLRCIGAPAVRGGGAHFYVVARRKV